MIPTMHGILALLLALTCSFAQDTPIPLVCHKGVQIIALVGQGIANGSSSYGLSGSLVSSIMNTIPDSDSFSVNYDRFPPNGDIATYFVSEVTGGVSAAYTQLNNYVTACPNTPIVLFGYSEGAVVVANLVCGASSWGFSWTNPLASSFIPHIIGVILYGDETRTAGQPYNYGGCTANSPYLPRLTPSNCNAYAPVMQSFCAPNDVDCCGTADPTVPSPITWGPWHWTYPGFDYSVTNFIVNNYNDYLKGTPISSTPPATTAPVSPSTVSGGFSYQGCFADLTAGVRPLTSNSLTDTSMTLEMCATFCSAHSYFGIEDSTQCYCGDSFSGTTAIAADCYLTCAGNMAEYCGGPNQLNVYYAAGKALATGLPSGVVALGCYADSSTRVLPVNIYTNSSNTNSQCALACRAAGYPFSGTEFGAECYCGYTAPTTSVDGSGCNMACAGASSTTCGGSWRISIQQDTTILSNAGLPTNVTRLGCFVDSSTRALPLKLYSSTSNTNTQCASSCRAAGYPISGTENGNECWCGYNAPSTSAPPANCNVGCSGDSTQSCGAGWRLSVQLDLATQSLLYDATASGYTLLGCYIDSSTRILPTQLSIAGGASSMTVRNCIAAASAAGYGYAGLEAGQECWASNTGPASSLLAAGVSGDVLYTGGCSEACVGNTTESCGGGWRLMVYSSTGS